MARDGQRALWPARRLACPVAFGHHREHVRIPSIATMSGIGPLEEADVGGSVRDHDVEDAEMAGVVAEKSRHQAVA